MVAHPLMRVAISVAILALMSSGVETARPVELWGTTFMGSELVQMFASPTWDPVWIIIIGCFVNGILVGTLIMTCCCAWALFFRMGYEQQRAATQNPPLDDDTMKPQGAQNNSMPERSQQMNPREPDGKKEASSLRARPKAAGAREKHASSSCKDRVDKRIFASESQGIFHHDQTCHRMEGSWRTMWQCGNCKPEPGNTELCVFPSGDKYHSVYCKHVAAVTSNPTCITPCSTCVTGNRPLRLE